MSRIRTALAAALAVVLAAVGVAGLVLTSSDPYRTYADVVRAGLAPLEVRCGDRVLELPARWSFPAVGATGLVWLQHGFARSGDRMADLADQLAAEGMLVVAPTANALGDCSLSSPAELVPGIAAVLLGMGRQDGALARSARAAAEEAGVGLDGLPVALVLAGHSAGAAAMTGVAAAILEQQEGRADEPGLRQLLLLDPVEGVAGVMDASLDQLRDLPVLTIAGEPGPCNANGNGPALLRDAREGFFGVRLTGGCHCDAEGASTNAACSLVCGASDTADVRVLHHLARTWVADAVGGSPSADAYPGGAVLERLLDEGAITLLEG